MSALLDEAHGGDSYQQALQAQRQKVDDPETTPSARVLREMREKDLPFFRLAMSYSQQWGEHFRSRELSTDTQARFADEARQSLQRQQEMEATEDVSFEAYLTRFYDQYKALQPTPE